MGLDSRTDLEELSARVRTQSEDAPGSDTQRVTYRSIGEVDVGAFEALLEALDAGVDRGDLVFVVSSTNAELLLEREAVDDVEELEDRLGHEVRVAEHMPDDTLLLLDPDAVDGERVVDPTRIVCGMLGAADQQVDSP